MALRISQSFQKLYDAVELSSASLEAKFPNIFLSWTNEPTSLAQSPAAVKGQHSWQGGINRL